MVLGKELFARLEDHGDFRSAPLETGDIELKNVYVMGGLLLWSRKVSCS